MMKRTLFLTIALLAALQFVVTVAVQVAEFQPPHLTPPSVQVAEFQPPHLNPIQS
jgi:hypothetical protein